MKVTVGSWGAALLWVLVVGCGGKEQTGVVDAAAGLPSAQTTELLPLTAEAVAPVFRLLSGSGRDEIWISFARSVLAADAVGKPAGDLAVLRIEPPLAGKLEVIDPATLVFRPESALPASTGVTVTLEQVRSVSGDLRAPAAGGWSQRFETPALQFERAEIAQFVPDRRFVEIDLSFSAAVGAGRVRDAVKFETLGADGNPTGKPSLRLLGGGSGAMLRTVRLRLSGPTVVAGSSLAFLLNTEELGLAGSGSPEVRRNIPLPGGPRFEIKNIVADEMASGWSLEIVCNDTAVEGRRWYWDEKAHDSYQLSPRCELDPAEIASSVRIEPDVAVTATPSEGGFRLIGPFVRGAYRVTVAAGARTADGGVLNGTVSRDVQVPARSAQLRFDVRGRYLSRRSFRSVPLRHLNVEKAALVVRRISPESLVYWMSDDDNERASERTSDIVFKGEVTLGAPLDEERSKGIELDRYLPKDLQGVFELVASAGAAASRTRLLLTDISLVAKRTGLRNNDDAWGDEVVIWALRSASLRPIRGVQVEVIRRSGTVLASCSTDVRGECRLPVVRDADPESPPFAIVARDGSDLTYLKFDELRMQVEEQRIAGESYVSSVGPVRESVYRAFLYGDRGVYRPGERAPVGLLVREDSGAAAPAGMPVEVQLYDARGKLTKGREITLDETGFADLSFDLPNFAPTGRWEVRALAGDRVLGSRRFQVEEFVPERLAVEVTGLQPQLLAGEQGGARVNSRFLFGGTPAGAVVSLECELHPGRFAPSALSGFQFGVWVDENRAQRPLVLGTVVGEVGTDGSTELQCPAPAQGGGIRGPAALRFRASVREAGSGRATVAEAVTPVHPERYYLGLQSAATKATSGQSVGIVGRVVDWSGGHSQETHQIDLEVFRLEREWGLYYDAERGYERYRVTRRPVSEGRATLTANGGAFVWDFVPQQDASYLVRARSGKAVTELFLDGGNEDYWWWSPEQTEIDLTPRPDRAAWINLEAPPRAKVGQRLEVHFKSPYKGRALLSLESDRLESAEWRDVEAGEVVWKFAAARFVPNVYATVLVLKDPHLESEQAFLPDRAFGVASIALEPEARRFEVKVSLPSEVRSNSQLVATLEVEPKPRGLAYATVAVVDEGILSLTKFATPDPFAAIFAPRALAVATYETIGWSVLLPPNTSSASPGGDQAGPMLGRVQPTRPVALWSGRVAVPATGRVEIPFAVPQYRGALRVMAVVADHDRFGWAEGRVAVRDPVVVQATLPRFLIPGDELAIPVQLTNTTNRRAQAEVRLSTEEVQITPFPAGMDLRSDPIEIIGERTLSRGLEPGESATVSFRARVRAEAGAVRFEVVVQADGARTAESSEVPIMPKGSLERRVERLELQAGTLDLLPKLQGWAPLSSRTRVWVTDNPYADVFSHMGPLVRYPYGCLEQTVSSTRPLLLLPRMTHLLDPKVLAGKNADAMVQSGIERVLSMQTPDGGFGYWLGDDQSSYWASAYAMHLLLDAVTAGWEVPAPRLEEALRWAERVVTRDDGGDGAGWEPWGEVWRGRSYLHYVLARAGKAQRARAEQLLGEVERSTADIKQRYPGRQVWLENQRREAAYLLMAALHLGGDLRYEERLRQFDLSNVQGERTWDGSFFSDRRRRALMLATYVELFGVDDQAWRLGDLVADSLRGRDSSWYSTQELVWGLVALGKLVDGKASDLSQAPTLRAHGNRLPPMEGAAPGNWVWVLPRASEYRALQLDIPAFDGGQLFVVLDTEGVRRGAGFAPAMSEGLEVRRRVRRVDGTVFDPSSESVSLGEVLFVELLLRNKLPDTATNLALVDRLPTGLEIENPRLGRDRSVDWIDEEALWLPEHMDLRDDRLEVFGDLASGKEATVVYSVRATLAGEFSWPATVAEAMYQPSVAARSVGTSLRVR